MMLALPSTAGTRWRCHGECDLPMPHEHVSLAIYKLRIHDCENPRWSFGDDGHGFCQNCNGWEPRSPRPVQRLSEQYEERREEHYSPYTGWDAGFSPEVRDLPKGHPWRSE